MHNKRKQISTVTTNHVLCSACYKLRGAWDPIQIFTGAVCACGKPAIYIAKITK